VSHACKQIRWIPEASHVIHNISVRLFLLSSCSDWTRAAITHRRIREWGMDERLRGKKRVREESSSETVVLALLNVQTFYYLSITLLTIKESFRLSRF